MRILSNPRFSPNALTPSNAVALLQANLSHPAHQFWPDDVSLEQGLKPFAQRLAGHQQVRDAYLLGLVMHRKGKLATLDRAIRALIPDKTMDSDCVVTI